MNTPPITHGVVTYPDFPGLTDNLFRVALKALIFNKKGEVLVVKESGRGSWDIPGGGIDHGESIREGLTRELKEEVGYAGDFTYTPVVVSDPHVIASRGVSQVRITFLVATETDHFEPGVDADDVRFANPTDFKNSESEMEREIYALVRYALESKA